MHVVICNGMCSTTLCKHNLNICNICYYCIKPVSHLFNSHLSGTNPCIQCTMKSFQLRYELPIKSFEPALEIWYLSYTMWASYEGSGEPGQMHRYTRPSLLTYTNYGCRKRLRPRIRSLVPLDMSA